MRHLDKYILIERKRILNEGMLDDAKEWIKKFGKDNIPSLFGYSKGEKVRISKFGRMSEVNSAPSNAATLKEVFESYFSKKNKPFLRKKYADKMFGTGRGFDKMMTDARREWYLKKLQSEYGTIQRVIHNKIWNKEDQKIKYFKSSILDRASKVIGLSELAMAAPSAAASGGAAAPAAAAAAGVGAAAIFFTVLVGGAAALGIADYFDDTDENVDEDDILEYAEKVIKEALEDIEKQFSGDPREIKGKVIRKPAASFDDSDINDRLTEFLAEELAERYRMWFLKDPKGRQGVAGRDGSTTVSWRGVSSAADKKWAYSADGPDAAATAATATAVSTSAKLPPMPKAKKPFYCPSAAPHNKVFCENEDLWALEARNAQMWRATGKAQDGAFNAYLKAKKAAGGDKDKQVELIKKRIKSLEDKYLAANQSSSAAAAGAVGKAKVKVSSGGGSTSSQNAMLAKTSHKNLAGLQNYLMGAGFFGVKAADMKQTRTFRSGEADGRYGPETQTAIKNLQNKLGVKADGVYGPNTDAAFRKKPEVQGKNSAVAPEASTSKPSSSDIASLKKEFDALSNEAIRLATGVGVSSPKYKEVYKKMRFAQAALQKAQAQRLEEIIRQETNALLKERGMA